MGLMDAHHHDEPSHDTHGAAQTKRRLGVMIAAAVVLLAGYFVVFRPKPAPERPPATTPVEQARSDDEAASQPKAEAPETATPAPRTPRKGAAPVAEPVPAAPEPLGPVLLVNSDVPGASVFVDRKYLGTTPLTTREVTQGTHQLNASAEGHDGIVQTIEVAGSGESSITLKFREVRLDESVAVVHKHGMGACEGRLGATAAGLRYETSNKGDAFSLPFAELEVFEIDYLEKTLRVKKRAGKTWNFTDRSENADKLFVFHRDVTKARTKLASQ
jgi:hypothetical protein